MMPRVLIVTVMCLAVVHAQSPAAQAPAATSATSATCPEMATALTAVMRNDVRLRDWSNLARYREANHALSTPATRDARVVFMGDSITDAWQQPRYGGFFPRKPHVDRGISGQTTPQMLVRVKPDALALEPKAGGILAGTNDPHSKTRPPTHQKNGKKPGP